MHSVDSLIKVKFNVKKTTKYTDKSIAIRLHIEKSYYNQNSTDKKKANSDHNYTYIKAVCGHNKTYSKKPTAIRVKTAIISNTNPFMIVMVAE